MTFERFWAILVKQWKFVVISFFVVGLGAFVGSKLMTPVYQSSALVQVAIRSSDNQADYNSLLASDQLVQTEAALATSDPVLREVASHYSGLTVQQLSEKVTATSKINTQLFEIDAVDPSPVRAAKLANDVATTLIKQQLQVIQQDDSQSQQQVQQDLSQTRVQIDTLTSKISALQAKEGNSAQVAVLQAQLSGLQQHYNQWQTLLAQLELTQAQNGNFLRITQPAQPAMHPVRPIILLNVAGGLIAGLLLGTLLALLYEQLDTRIRTSDELVRLMEWPVLATIWQAKIADRETVINPEGNDLNVEPYRILRTNIGFSAIDKPLHSVLVTSAVPRDGKSSIAANLAIFMAKAGKNTLLIDADLRRPTQHLLFGLPADSQGLSNAVLAFSISGSPTLHQFSIGALPTQQTNIPTTINPSLDPFVHRTGILNLWVMPSGPLPPNPPELLDSKAMQCFLADIRNSGIEMIIFDSPPILGLSDASILSSKVDGVLVVADITTANKGNLKQVRTLLAQTGANILGCVVNKQRQKRNDSPYYYYTSESENNSGKRTKSSFSSAVPGTPSPLLSPSSFDQRTHSN